MRTSKDAVREELGGRKEWSKTQPRGKKKEVILMAKREEENGVRKGKGRGYGNIQSLQRSPKKGI